MWDIIWAWTFNHVPWYVWPCLAVGAAFVVISYLPNRLGAILACLLVAWGFLAGGFTTGVTFGTSTERASWERKVVAEKARLKAEFDQQLAAEALRRAAAEASVTTLTKEKQDALDLLATDTRPWSSTVLPPDVADGLRNIGKAGSGNGATGNAKRAHPVPGLFRQYLLRHSAQ